MSTLAAISPSALSLQPFSSAHLLPFASSLDKIAAVFTTATTASSAFGTTLLALPLIVVGGVIIGSALYCLCSCCPIRLASLPLHRVIYHPQPQPYIIGAPRSHTAVHAGRLPERRYVVGSDREPPSAPAIRVAQSQAPHTEHRYAVGGTRPPSSVDLPQRNARMAAGSQRFAVGVA